MNNQFNFEGFRKDRAETFADNIINDAAEDAAEVEHDDGAMFVSWKGTRYCFHIGQDNSRSEYNRKATRILNIDLGITGTVSGDNN